jgi:single-strand DNA-binding protein
MAENVSKYQKKGNRLYVDGRISYSKYTDRDGNERWSTDIIANEIKFLDRRDANLGGGGASDNNGGGQAAYNPGPTSGGSDDDIPF